MELRTRLFMGGAAVLGAVAATACSGNGDAAGDSAETSPSVTDGSRTTSASDTASQDAADACLEDGKAFQGEARLYIEHNATDQDTGVHGTFDQEGLAAGCLTSPQGEQVLIVDPTGKLDSLGINQFFFESREPPADEYSVDDLKVDFPEGNYRISGVDYQGTPRVGNAVFTHDIPAEPQITEPRLAEEERAGSVRLEAAGFTVRWNEVTRTLDGDPVDIAGYEVIVTDADYSAPDNLSQPEYDVHVGPDTTELAVPDGFLQSGRVYELEVLALEKSGNQTISLGYFTAR